MNSISLKSHNHLILIILFFHTSGTYPQVVQTSLDSDNLKSFQEHQHLLAAVTRDLSRMVGQSGDGSISVNVGMSVSRVGGQTQAPVMKRLAAKLRLEYAQFLELEVFTRFGAMVDERTKQTIEHGRRIRAILAQVQYQPLSLAQQVILLLAVEEGKLDELPLHLIESFRNQLGVALQQRCPRALARIEETGGLSDEDRQDLIRAMEGILADLNPRKQVD